MSEIEDRCGNRSRSSSVAKTRRAVWRGVVVAAAGAIALAGCSGSSSADLSVTSSTTSKIQAEVTTINGSVPPGELVPLQDVTTMLDTIDANGNRLVITKGTRVAGTRVGIHIHRYGGHTCVLSGEITDFIEDREPTVFPAGTCYYMPPDTIMAAANLGTIDAVLIDTFTLPPGEPTITILEPGWPAN